MMRCRCFLAAAIGMLAFGLGSAADDADAVKEKLFQAKKEYDGEVKKFKQSVEEIFDKREETARAAGDKKAVDEVKNEREAFAKLGNPPSTLPEAIKQRAAAARLNLDKAYTAALKDYLKLKLDADAEAIEKQRQECSLSSAFFMGKRTYLASLKHFNVKVVKGHPFTNNGTHGETKIKLKMDGQYVPHSLFLHPIAKDCSSVSYPLAGKYTAFRAIVGVPKIEEVTFDPASPLTFEVLCDGNSLWKSEPIQKIETFQACQLSLENAKTLTLRVHCPMADAWARAVWFEPILVE